MKGPDLFVIGAQKCGTTTLYHDLAQHPEIALTEKESSTLTRTTSLKEAVGTFAESAPATGTRLVDVSTEYAMRPRHNVANVAKQVSPNARVLYIVRDPVARTLSHHHHELSARTMTGGIDQAIRTYPRLTDFSRYFYQLEPWMDAFEADRIRVVKFEDYIADRSAHANALYEWLGVSSRQLHNPEEVYNAATDKRVGIGLGGRIARSKIYRNTVRRAAPSALKSAGKAILLPKAPPRPAPPRDDTLRFLVGALAPEVDELSRYTGTGRWWDLEETWLG